MDILAITKMLLYIYIYIYLCKYQINEQYKKNSKSTIQDLVTKCKTKEEPL